MESQVQLENWEWFRGTQMLEKWIWNMTTKMLIYFKVVLSILGRQKTYTTDISGLFGKSAGGENAQV